MRWKIQKLVAGETTRLLRCFAWFPREINGYKIWLEFYWRNQIYEEYHYRDDYAWRTKLKWKTLSEHLY
jgi:hypothetical protein